MRGLRRISSWLLLFADVWTLLSARYHLSVEASRRHPFTLHLLFFCRAAESKWHVDLFRGDLKAWCVSKAANIQYGCVRLQCATQAAELYMFPSHLHVFFKFKMRYDAAVDIIFLASFSHFKRHSFQHTGPLNQQCFFSFFQLRGILWFYLINPRNWLQVYSNRPKALLPNATVCCFFLDRI